MKKNILLLLLLFIIFAAILNFLPHLNYYYPLHVDEYVHWQYANHLSSSSPLYFGGIYGNNLEAGFHYLLASLNSLGLDYNLMFYLFPTLIIILICLGVFIFTRRMFGETAGLFAVLFVALLQNSVMLLGPVFLVPMAIGLFLISIGLYLIHIKSRAWILILGFLLIMHPPTALVFFVFININFLIDRKKYWRNISFQLLAFLIALPIYIPIFLQKGSETINSLAFTPIISALFIPRLLGWIFIIIILFGIYSSFTNRKYHIALFSIVLLILIFIFYQFKVEIFIPYARTLMYLFLIFAVAFGLGCAKIIEIGKTNRTRLIISVLLLVLILFSGLQAKLESNNYFYHIIDDKDVLAFKWIEQNTDKNAIAVLDPIKANAFTPIAEREVYSRIVQGPNKFYEDRNKEIGVFFNNSCRDIGFLKKNNISIIYGECNNSNLTLKFPQVYLFQSG